jgi:hypothetical protein
MNVEVKTTLESYEIVCGLLERRDIEEDISDGSAVEAIDRILVQFEGRTTQTLLEDHDGYELDTDFRLDDLDDGRI